MALPKSVDGKPALGQIVATGRGFSCARLLALAGAFEEVTAETPDLEKYMAGLEKNGGGEG